MVEWLQFAGLKGEELACSLVASGQGWATESEARG